MEEKGLMEDDLDFFYQEEDKYNPDFANFSCNVEETFENYKNKSFPQCVRQKRGSNLNRPGSNQKIVDPVEIYVFFTASIFYCKTRQDRVGKCNTDINELLHEMNA